MPLPPLNKPATRRGAIAGGLALGAMISGTGAATAREHRPHQSRRPLVIGHRGAPAWRPEHTLASYQRAIEDGADIIEPDLVATRDGVLVVRHENNLAETTDVADRPEFAERRAARIIDGSEATGWFSEDFTLAELKQLRAKERLGPLRAESSRFDGQFEVLTFAEVVGFAESEAAKRGRAIGLAPELKHSSYFASIGLPLEQRFLDEVGRHRYLGTAPVIVQSFEIANLKWLRSRLGKRKNIKLMQLTEGSEVPADRVLAGDKRTWRERLSPRGLAGIARYADYLAPWSRDLLPLAPDGSLGEAAPLIAMAHDAGLLVGTWTFRPENHFLATNYRSGAGEGARNPAGCIAEITRYLDAGIDAFFTDDPALGRVAVDGWLAKGR